MDPLKNKTKVLLLFVIVVIVLLTLLPRLYSTSTTEKYHTTIARESYFVSRPEAKLRATHPKDTIECALHPVRYQD